MNDIRIIKKINIENPTRRNLLKFAALGSAALLFSVASKKMSGISSGIGKHSLLKNFQNKDINVVEDGKEFTVYDKNGSSVLIFEKEV